MANPLLLASPMGHSDVVKLLLDNGVQVDLQDNNGFSSLMIASQNGHNDTDVLRLTYRLIVGHLLCC